MSKKPKKKLDDRTVYRIPSERWGIDAGFVESRHVCPQCGDYSFPHFERISVMQFDGTHDMVFENSTATQVDSTANARGAGVLIVFNGECGHRWSVHLLFHKGEVYEFLRMLDDAPPHKEYEDAADIKDVWRD